MIHYYFFFLSLALVLNGFILMSAFMDTIFNESVHIVDLLSSDSVFTSEFVYVVFCSFFFIHALI